jgi:rRNA maturation endonuclease Nob1
MPYYRCKRCAVILYSAASKANCSACGGPLAVAASEVVATTSEGPAVRASAG